MTTPTKQDALDALEKVLGNVKIENVAESFQIAQTIRAYINGAPESEE